MDGQCTAETCPVGSAWWDLPYLLRQGLHGSGASGYLGMLAQLGAHSALPDASCWSNLQPGPGAPAALLLRRLRWEDRWSPGVEATHWETSCDLTSENML